MIDDDARTILTFFAVNRHTEVVFLLYLRLRSQESFQFYFLEGKLLLGEVGDHDFLHMAKVKEKGFAERYLLHAYGLYGDFKLPLDLFIGCDDLSLFLIQ